MENGLIPFNGRFTIEGPRGHRTFQIKTVKGGKLKGQRILSLFVGRENTNDHDYQGFAFVADDAVKLWRRFDGSKDHKVFIDMLSSFTRLGNESRYYAMGYRFMMEAKCRRCNRALTNPTSIKSGIGPECAGRNLQAA